MHSESQPVTTNFGELQAFVFVAASLLLFILSWYILRRKTFTDAINTVKMV